jgi:hypothetical protein
LLPIFVTIKFVIQGNQMNTGVEILIQRLKDCPDDFQYNVNTDTSTKWNKLLMEALRSDVITDEEKTALRHEVTEMGRARFTENVMKVLAGEDESSDEGKWGDPNPYLVKSATRLGGQTLGAYSNTATATLSASGNLTTNSLTLGSTTISESTLKQLLDGRTLASKPGGFIKKHWWNKTLPELFGKK